MRVPFPQIDSALAVRSHMYICIEEGTQKEFVKCQTFKPVHLISNRRPYKNITEEPDLTRNPFSNKTTIDCDKSFTLENVILKKSLVTERRKNVCTELFNDIIEKINHGDFVKESLEQSQFLSLNPLAQ